MAKSPIITVNLDIDPQNRIVGDITKAIAEEIKKRFNKDRLSFVFSIKDVIRDSIRNQPEYYALSPNGILTADFGITDGQQRVDLLIEKWLSGMNISISLKPPTSGGLFNLVALLYITEFDFEELVNDPLGQFITEKGAVLEWLRWLLLEGSSIINREYGVLLTRKAPSSRTGLAIMISGERVRKFSVRPQFAGTRQDNFLTRAFGDAEVIINSIIRKGFEKAICQL